MGEGFMVMKFQTVFMRLQHSRRLLIFRRKLVLPSAGHSETVPGNDGNHCPKNTVIQSAENREIWGTTFDRNVAENLQNYTVS